jgi:hypothetical protein
MILSHIAKNETISLHYIANQMENFKSNIVNLLAKNKFIRLYKQYFMPIILTINSIGDAGRKFSHPFHVIGALTVFFHSQNFRRGVTHG